LTELVSAKDTLGMMISLVTIVFVFSTKTSHISNAFVTNTPFKPEFTSSPLSVSCATSPRIPNRQSFVLHAAEEGNDGGSKEEVQEIKEETEDSSAAAAEEAAKEEEEESDEEEEELELKSLKEQIMELESTLKQKNRDLSQMLGLADDYSKGGYSRKVAEMEGLRRLRKAVSKSNKLTARASILQAFLPILDKLKTLDDLYKEDEFQNNYAALSNDFSNTLKSLGVKEYTAKEGEKVSALRENFVKEQYSDVIPKGCVIASVGSGYELEENVMRMADVVISLGSEAEAKAAVEKEEREKDDEAEDSESSEEGAETEDAKTVSEDK